MALDQPVLGPRGRLVDVLEDLDPLRAGELAVGVHQRQPAAARLQLGPGRGEHRARDARDLRHAADVEHDHLELVRALGQLAHDRLRAREQQIAVQGVHPSAGAELVEHLLLVGRVAAARRPRADVPRVADRRAAVGGDVQEVQLELARELPAGGDAADAVAVAVQPRRVERDPDLPGEHREHAAADAALGRQADVDDPLAGRVVHAAGRHHAQHALDDLGLEQPLAAARLHAAVGERGRHQREVAAVEPQRALAEVELDGGVGIGLDHAGAAQQVADRAVAVGDREVGAEDRVVALAARARRRARTSRAPARRARRACRPRPASRRRSRPR